MVESNSHLGLDHPEGGIEDVEVPWGLPFAPCPTIVVGDTSPGKCSRRGQEAAEANENG